MPDTQHPLLLKQSVCRWCFDRFSLEELCQKGAQLGLAGIDTVSIDEIETVRRYGLEPSLIWGVPGSLENGLNRRENHASIIEFFEQTIPQAARLGAERLICFSGNRRGLSDEQALDACQEGLQKILPLAESHGVTLVMELLNSRIDHPDYQCDRTTWGKKLVDRFGSERFKLLYDIYHMAVMGEDVTESIRQDHAYFDHYHTAGVPGRHEIGAEQTLDYPSIMQAIKETGFQGYIAHEFLPTRTDPFQSLQEAIELCRV